MLATRGLALLALSGTAVGLDTKHSANPIRRVVTMLQNMQAKVAAEGVKEKELFDKFMCYCQTGATDLQAAIDAAASKAPQTESALNSAIAKKAQLQGEVEKHQSDRGESKTAIASATALREKQATAYAKDSSEFKSNIAAMEKAIAAMEGGAAGSFLQTAAASKVKKLAIDMEISPADRDQLMGFLAENNGNVGPALGIVRQMKDTMVKDLAEITDAENESIADFDALVAAKEKQIEADTSAIEDKIERIGNLGVDIETMKGDLSDTQESLLADKQFLANLDKTCATKKQEWDVRSATRTEELLALADTIKILNDDDALELFKKTLPATSLLQTEVAAQEMRKEALEALKGQTHHNVKLDLIALSLRGKKVSFEKVIGMIDGMVSLLGDEQTDDDNKKEICEQQLDKAEDDLKMTETTISDLEKSISEAKELQASLVDEIAVLTKELKALDEQVEEAGIQRREEHEDYVNLMAGDTAAKEVLGLARNRMQKFYNPSLAEPAASFIQLHVESSRVAPPPPPATWDAYAKKSEGSNGVLAMIDSIVADLDKEMQTAEVEEKEAQSEYEQFTRDAAEKRIADSKSVADKEAAKAESEVAMDKEIKERTTKMKEALATVNWISSLHKDCDWLLQNYETRKEARVGEIDALKKAKAVLSGADYSFVQKRQFLQRVSRA